jgi:hypothetical protein
MGVVVTLAFLFLVIDAAQLGSRATQSRLRLSEQTQCYEHAACTSLHTLLIMPNYIPLRAIT